MQIHHFALALGLCFTSCTSSSTDPKALNDAGFQKISAQDFEGAKNDFEAAVDAIGSDTSNGQYKLARLGLIETLAHLNADKAKEEFMALASSLGGKLDPSDYSSIGGILVSANATKPGLDIVHAGLEKFKDDPQLMKVLEALLTKATSDPSLTQELGNLGYL